VAKAVGLDIGSRACKVAVLSSGGKGAKLLRYVEKEYDLGSAGVLTPAVVLQAVKETLHEARAPKSAVAVAMQAEQCTLREITVPFTDDDQIAKVVKFEFEPHLHSASIEDVVIDYVKTGLTKNGARLLVIAASKDTLRLRLDQLKEVGVDPLHVDVDVAALFNTATQSGVFEKHPNCLIIDIGARTTKTLLVQDGRLKVARSIRLGAQSPVTRLTSEFQGDADAARRAMEDVAGVEALARPPEQASTLEIVASVRAIEAAAADSQESEFLARVLRETQRTLPAIGEDRPLTRIFLTGLGSLRPHARQRIAEHYGVEVEDLPTLDAVTHSLPPSEADKVARTGAVAVGVALKVLGIDAGEIDLRRDEFRFARTFDAIKVALATGITLVFFGLFLFVVSQHQEWRAVKKQRKTLQEVMKKELNDPVFAEYEKSVKDARKSPDSAKTPDEDAYFQATKRRLTDIRNHLKNELGLATEVPPIRSCLETWSVVMSCAKAVRSKVGYMAIRQEKYDQERGTLTVVFGDLPEIDTLTNELRKHTEIFEAVDPGAPRPEKDGRYQVDIKLTIKPKETAAEVAKETADGASPAETPKTPDDKGDKEQGK
jgi:type IV pilus assembly protein PilM